MTNLSETSVDDISKKLNLDLKKARITNKLLS